MILIVKEQEMTQNLKEALINEGRPPELFKGCTNEEIQQVMKVQNVKRLPSTFVEYLQIMGHGGIAEILLGDSADFNSMLYLKESLIDQVESYSPNFTLPNNVFVFFGHQDVEFRYFLTDNSDDDPPVFMHIIDDDDAKVVAQSFTEYLETMLNLFRKLKR